MCRLKIKFKTWFKSMSKILKHNQKSKNHISSTLALKSTHYRKQEKLTRNETEQKQN